jgi:hypothetical protein
MPSLIHLCRPIISLTNKTLSSGIIRSLLEEEQEEDQSVLVFNQSQEKTISIPFNRHALKDDPQAQRTDLKIELFSVTTAILDNHSYPPLPFRL